MKLFLSIALMLQISICFSQTYYGQIINNKNDTISVQILIKGNTIFKNNKILSIQEKITVIENGISKDYYPADLKSFKINMNKEVKTYDSIDNSTFAERFYSNKLKLYYKLVKVETKQSPYFAIYRVFLIKKPNQQDMTTLIPNGFSRLITQNEMLEKITDCEISVNKIKNDEVKISNEEKLIDFVIDYEKNCFN
ncbi:hypothetical protein [[Flexibacter] sp. ATCC 35103]|uniref:hypothetical protein n=1 Tax=[Flexibacter] sp. ATCC 35103 TaxID=1937528 RepID=UPI0009C74942|nr:hypothetical protein [[Flexibacter] sp. ATCC 35103]OMQ13559.1 hypothetical protein BXU01_03525 [[Flexibacter] sp. ATCC 35103]